MMREGREDNASDSARAMKFDRPPPEECLRAGSGGDPATDLLAALVAFGEDLGLLLRRPGAAPTGPRKYFQTAHRLRLRFVQKLCVRHVSNPLDSAGRHSPISSRSGMCGIKTAYEGAVSGDTGSSQEKDRGSGAPHAADRSGVN
jgi:hypothetical protein